MNRWSRSGALRSAGLVAVVLLAGCTDRAPTVPGIDAAAGGGGDPSVTATDPNNAPQDTTLEVVVSGSGFDRGSTAQWAIAGVPAPKVRTNSTRFVSPKQLVASITIALDADTGAYDVIVTTTTGKKGIGTEMFTVRPKGGIGNSSADPEIAYCCVTVANANGSNPTGVLSYGEEPSWSPLGAGTEADPYQIVVHQAPGQPPGRLAIVDLAIVGGVPTGTNVRPLSPTWAWSPAWSPGGDEIAYAEGSTPDPPSSIWVIAASDGVPVAVYDGRSDVRFPTWSPDGQYLAFKEETSTGDMLKIVDRASGVSWVIVDSTEFLGIRYPDWARTKNAIAFAAWPGGAFYHVYVLELDPNLRPIGAPRLLAKNASSPSWSPDDTKLVTDAGMFEVATGKRIRPAAYGTWADWRR